MCAYQGVRNTTFFGKHAYVLNERSLFFKLQDKILLYLCDEEQERSRASGQQCLFLIEALQKQPTDIKTWMLESLWKLFKAVEVMKTFKYGHQAMKTFKDDFKVLHFQYNVHCGVYLC